MITLNDFSKYYKTISDTELLGILENPDDYQPLAVEAAKIEFANRQLSDSAIKEAKEPLIAKQILKEKQKEKVKAIEDKVKATGYTLIETLNPIQSGISSPEKKIRLIVIVFGGLFLYHIINDFQTHLVIAKDFPRFPYDTISYFIPLILLPVAIFTFWKRKSFGWTLLVIYLTFSTVEAIWSLCNSITWRSSGPELDNFFPRPSPVPYIIRSGFLIALIIVISKADIRQVFSIKEQRIAPTIGIAVFLSFAMLLAVLLSLNS
ncbi:MAG TPA: hypothetical protein VIY47_05025 [Ignavibacteriaceae bacterium]